MKICCEAEGRGARAGEVPAAVRVLCEAQNTTACQARCWVACAYAGVRCTAPLSFAVWRAVAASAPLRRVWAGGGNVTVRGSGFGEACIFPALAFGAGCTGYDLCASSAEARDLAAALGVEVELTCDDTKSSSLATTSWPDLQGTRVLWVANALLPPAETCAAVAAARRLPPGAALVLERAADCGDFGAFEVHEVPAPGVPAPFQVYLVPANAAEL